MRPQPQSRRGPAPSPRREPVFFGGQWLPSLPAQEILPFLDVLMNSLTQSVFFCVWLLPLGVMFLGLIRVVACQ